MSLKQNEHVKVFGYPPWWTGLQIVVFLIFVHQMIGPFSLYMFVPLVIGFSVLSLPFIKLTIISPEEIVVRRWYKRLGRVETIRMEDVRSATTTQPPTLKAMIANSGDNARPVLRLHMKDDSITELTLGRYTRCKALEKELGKYVELFGAPGLLEM